MDLRSKTCSFDLSCPCQEINNSRVTFSTRRDTSAQGSLGCLFGTGKLQRMLQNSAEIQAPLKQKEHRLLVAVETKVCYECYDSTSSYLISELSFTDSDILMSYILVQQTTFSMGALDLYLQCGVSLLLMSIS